MGQRYRDEAGHIWEIGPDGKPSLVAAAPSPSSANPKLPGELTGQNLSNARTKQEIDLASATATSTAAKAKADAAKAELDLRNAQDAYNSAHPKGANATVLGPDSLKSLSVPDQELVKALAEGRLAFPAGFALKAPWWQQKLEQVAAYDPSFDATNYNNRAKARAMLLSGKVGTSANALNTMIGHAGLLNDQISGTASHNMTGVNAIENWWDQHVLGQSGITNYKDTAGKLASEETSVYRNGGGAEADVNRYLQSFDPNAADKQKHDVVRNTLDLAASKQAANLYQYNLGSGGKPSVDLLDAQARKVLDQFPDIRDKYFAAPAGSLSSAAAALLQHNGGTPPPPSGPGAPPTSDVPPSVGPSGPHDYSGMVGGPGAAVASAQYRTQFDPVAASALASFIKHGVPYETAAAYAQSHGFNPPSPDEYAAGVAFAKQHNGAVNVSADRSVPTTLGERLAASPAAAAIVGAGTGATAGLSDVAGRALAGPQWDANRQALALTNPKADLAGNVAGGVAGMLGGEAALGRLAPGLIDAARASRVAPFLPAAGDATYGATYGASENPNDPLQGALTGAATGVGGGMFARGGAKAIGRTIAPDAGALAPLYQQGVMPTIGQRAAAMSGPISSRIGKAINTVEQAMQSVPVLGALPSTARQGARNDFQRGAFNDALGELGTQLPNGTGVGPEAHAFTSSIFNHAYDTARSGMQFVPDAQFAHDASQFAAQLNDGTLNAEQVKQVQQRINTAVQSRLANQPVMGGEAYKNAASELSDTQRAWAKDDPLKANALGDFLSIFDGAARRNSDPAATALLDRADAGYAKLVRIQKASQLGGAAKDAGTFTPNNYASAVKQMGGGMRSNNYSRGDALGQDYAQAGLNLSDTMPDSGTPGRLATMGLLGGAEGAALATGHLGVSPAALALFAPYIGKAGAKLIAPRSATLPPALADAANLVGQGLYKRSNKLGMFGAPLALDYFGGQ